MSYRHIENLYKNKEILLFKEAWAAEKIHGCLKKGTLILLPNNQQIPIEKVVPGTEIVTYDEINQNFTSSVVEDILIQETDIKLPWMEVELTNSQKIICTEDHPFLTQRGWIAAKDLTLDDNILTV